MEFSISPLQAGITEALLSMPGEGPTGVAVPATGPFAAWLAAYEAGLLAGGEQLVFMLPGGTFVTATGPAAVPEGAVLVGVEVPQPSRPSPEPTGPREADSPDQYGLPVEQMTNVAAALAAFLSEGSQISPGKGMITLQQCADGENDSLDQVAPLGEGGRSAVPSAAKSSPPPLRLLLESAVALAAGRSTAPSVSNAPLVPSPSVLESAEALAAGRSTVPSVSNASPPLHSILESAPALAAGRPSVAPAQADAGQPTLVAIAGTVTNDVGDPSEKAVLEMVPKDLLNRLAMRGPLSLGNGSPGSLLIEGDAASAVVAGYPPPQSPAYVTMRDSAPTADAKPKQGAQDKLMRLLAQAVKQGPVEDPGVPPVEPTSEPDEGQWLGPRPKLVQLDIDMPEAGHAKVVHRGDAAYVVPKVHSPPEHAMAVSKPPRLPPSRPSIETLGDYAVKSVRFLVSNGESTLKVRLIPESLGELRLSVSAAGDGVSVQLVAANPAVREVLEAQLVGLREALVRDGIDLTKLTVSADLPSGHAAPGYRDRRPSSSLRVERNPALRPVIEKDADALPVPRAGPLHGRTLDVLA